MLDELKVISTEQIYLHEEYELERLKKLSNKIKNEQVLKNPPIALQLAKDKYLILDGAHRTLSLKQLNCKRMVVQVVKADYLSIGAWSHHIADSEGVLEVLKGNSNIFLSKNIKSENSIATVFINGIKYDLNINPELEIDMEMKIKVWKEIVNAYTNKYPFTRITNDELIPLDGIVFSYTLLELYQIKQLVESNLLLPAGVTKFKLNCGRILNLNIPLSFLIREDFVEEDWMELLELWEKSIRLYTDPVLLCEI
ncbi:ParB N-terminal domain-containing protein [Bacillus wiedmannii]|uniref:ParB N-terminal domain-containing protein n=1 Tax=Bacillus wiedmannii TaxID=1890302 RepID=UPI0028532034|nr:ParB N-terminal domain-containing protein [Bacillus wiedmannii]MDR4943259.1 ParB N-terminal domain-containing protein [Bacillus wiedmannii]